MLKMHNETNDELMTPKEVCERLKISPKTLEAWISTNKLSIPYYKVGGGLRFKKADVEQLIVKQN